MVLWGEGEFTGFVCCFFVFLWHFVFNLHPPDDNPESQPYYKYTGAAGASATTGNSNSDYYNLQQLEENYQIAQYHQEIRSHYAQQNPGGNLLGKGMFGMVTSDLVELKAPSASSVNSAGLFFILVCVHHLHHSES